jgi:D-lactate dehydrogenase
LKRLLDERHLAGIGLDVFEEEGTMATALRNPGSPPAPQVMLISQLLARPNVLLTPHNAFNTQEALQRKAAMSVEQIRHFLKNRDFVWKV